MDAAAGRHVSGLDVRQGNGCFRPSSSNLQVVTAIRHFIRETMNVRLPQKIPEKSAKNAHDEQAGQRILPQAAVERGRGYRERDQRGGGQPNTALEQSS